MQVPLTKFSGFVKQVKGQDLGAAATIILEKAFPGFWPSDPNTDASKARLRAAQKHGDDVFDDRNTPRRFSGCWGLPRGRYFTLSHDENGDDAQTLMNELNAYMDPARAGVVMYVPESVFIAS